MSFTHVQTDKDMTITLAELGASANSNTAYLLDFAKAVSSRVRGVTFQRSVGYGGSELHLCLGDSPYVACTIGYRDYTETSRTKYYGVYSRNIANMKCVTNNDNHYRKLSTSLTVAVKNVSKHLRAYSADEIFRVTRHDAIGHASGASEAERRALRVAAHSVQQGFPTMNAHGGLLDQELQHLVDTGHTFVNADFGMKVKEYIAVRAEFRGFLARERPMAMVWVRLVGGEQVISVTTIARVEENKTMGTTTYTPADVPEYVAGKVAMLGMCAEGEYVPEVGVKMHGGVFHIHTE